MATKVARNKQVPKEHPDKTPNGAKRSPEWPKVRKAWLKEHPECAACGGKKKVEVHHRLPFHLHPEKELDPTNFISLCEAKKECNHHLHFGHLGDYKLENPRVTEMVKEYVETKAAAEKAKASFEAGRKK